MASESGYITVTELRDFMGSALYTAVIFPDADMEKYAITPAERWANQKMLASRFAHRIPYAAGLCPEELKEVIRYRASYLTKRRLTPTGNEISEQTMQDKREADELIRDFIAGKAGMGSPSEDGEGRAFSTIPDPGTTPT